MLTSFLQCLPPCNDMSSTCVDICLWNAGPLYNNIYIYIHGVPANISQGAQWKKKEKDTARYDFQTYGAQSSGLSRLNTIGFITVSLCLFNLIFFYMNSLANVSWNTRYTVKPCYNNDERGKPKVLRYIHYWMYCNMNLWYFKRNFTSLYLLLRHIPFCYSKVWQYVCIYIYAQRCPLLLLG